MNPLPRCFSCGELLLRLIAGRGAGIGPMHNGTYGVGCVITPQTPAYICSECGTHEGRLRDSTQSSVIDGIVRPDPAQPPTAVPGTSANMQRRERTGSGRQLARRERLDVRKAYYHWEGTFFQRVREFPVALFDRYGYVVIKNRAEYLNHPRIGGNERTNIPAGIASFTGYRKMIRPAY